MLIAATILSAVSCIGFMISVEEWADKAEPYRALRSAGLAAISASILTQCIIGLAV